MKPTLYRLYDEMIAKRIAKRINDEAKLANDLMKEFPDMTRTEALKIAYQMFNKIPLL